MIDPGTALHQPIEAVAPRQGGAEASVPSIIWSYPVPAYVKPRRIVLEGSGRGADFVPRSATLVDPTRPERPLLAPIGSNLLPRLKARTFGEEQRVRVSGRGTALTVRCRPGTSVAGFSLSSAEVYLPRGMNGRLRIEGRTTRPLQVSIVEAGRDAPPGGHASFAGTAEIPLSALSPASGDRHEIVFLCPDAGAELSIERVLLEPSPSGSVTVPRGTWIWRPETWIDGADAVAARAAEAGLAEVALQFPVSNGQVERPEAVRRALSSLGARGLVARAVEGDPRMIEEQGLRNAVSRVEALRRFNAGQEPRARISALEFDIEPYIGSAYRLDPRGTWRRWGLAVTRLAEAWGKPVGVVVPFWMLGEPGAGEAVEALRPHLEAVVVMAYRTELQEIAGASEPWLAWGAANRVPIVIALENGPIEEEVHRTYAAAPLGDLVLRRSQGDARVELLSATVPTGPADAAYAFSHQVIVQPRRISFVGDEPSRRAVEPQALRLLSSWRSFAGLRVHALFAEPAPRMSN